MYSRIVRAESPDLSPNAQPETSLTPQTGDMADSPSVEGLGSHTSIRDEFVDSLPLLPKLAEIDVAEP
jgi:hypothetical protein